jgi:hypothetical protein
MFWILYLHNAGAAEALVKMLAQLTGSFKHQ